MRLLSATLLATITFVTPAVASDPLLSGYSGPGGGDLTVLGTQILPGGVAARPDGPDRPLAAAKATPSAVANGSVAADGPTPRGAAATPGTASRPHLGAQQSTDPPKAPKRSSGAQPTATPGQTRKARLGARKVAAGETTVPSRTLATPPPATGSNQPTALNAPFPVSGRDALLAFVGLAALAGVAVATARAAGESLPGR
ncbi:MAG: hypothetical protein H0V22_10130 [Solirubrobacterales bacterium]|nr:hypothetical protein [Solirubrobacterales bacterium]